MQLLAGLPGGYAATLLQSIVALAGVCALAVVLLRVAAGKGLGRVPRGRALELVERLPLDARSAVCVVRAGSRVYLLGTSDGTSPNLLAELEAGTIEAVPWSAPHANGVDFRGILASLGRSAAPARHDSDAESTTAGAPRGADDV